LIKRFVPADGNCYATPHIIERSISNYQPGKAWNGLMFHQLRFSSFMTLLACIGSVPAFSADGGQLLGGSLNSPIKIEIFSDFQCPSCRDLYLGTIKQVLLDYSSKDKVCIIYHEFPLQAHAHARAAARFCEAASYLGGQNLLKVYDALFNDQAQWTQDGNLDAVLVKALPQKEYQKLKDMLQDPAINLAVDKEILLGAKKDIRSTPTMFIYYAGKEQQKVEGAIPYTMMKQFIDSIIK
jgi:protein-disulfide isomerase